jgi:5'-deoxynucleotidase YfbR-like HD superfamily hydrolase
MHDTAEAFTNDLPTPLKFALPIFKELEVKIETAMGNRFGFQYPYPDAVKLADTQMLLLEKTYVKLDTNEWEYYRDVEYEHLTDLVDLKGWQPIRAKREFLERFEELNNERLEKLRSEAA